MTPASIQPFSASLARQEEARHRQRLRALQKARKARLRSLQRKHTAEDKARAQHAAWRMRERLAYQLHLAEPDDRRLLRAWVKTWRECPAAYGPREMAS